VTVRALEIFIAIVIVACHELQFFSPRIDPDFSIALRRRTRFFRLSFAFYHIIFPSGATNVFIPVLPLKVSSKRHFCCAICCATSHDETKVFKTSKQ